MTAKLTASERRFVVAYAVSQGYDRESVHIADTGEVTA